MAGRRHRPRGLTLEQAGPAARARQTEKEWGCTEATLAVGRVDMWGVEKEIEDCPLLPEELGWIWTGLQGFFARLGRERLQ